MVNHDYSKDDIVTALKKVGICKNDSIFVHSNLGFFGKLKDATDKISYGKVFKDAIFEVIGLEGTLVVPAFSYSYCNNDIYDKEKTIGVKGIFTEFIREDNDSLRSDDPNFSINAIGKNAEFFTKDVPSHSFGKNSFWEKFLNYEGKFCNFNLDSGSTFIHYVEKLLKVPYRYDKSFHGKSIINGKEVSNIFYHFVYDLEKPTNYPDFSKFHAKAKEIGLTKTAELGKGQIVFQHNE